MRAFLENVWDLLLWVSKIVAVIIVITVWYYYHNDVIEYFTPKSYSWFYYPYWIDNDKRIVQHWLQSLSACRDRVKNTIDNVDNSEHDDYECGTNCRYEAKVDTYICNKVMQ